LLFLRLLPGSAMKTYSGEEKQDEEIEQRLWLIGFPCICDNIRVELRMFNCILYTILLRPKICL
jgi:hypothetical protein